MLWQILIGYFCCYFWVSGDCAFKLFWWYVDWHSVDETIIYKPKLDVLSSPWNSPTKFCSVVDCHHCWLYYVCDVVHHITMYLLNGRAIIGLNHGLWLLKYMALGIRSPQNHENEFIMDAMASQITSLTIVYWTVYSGTVQRKRQSSASLAFVWGIHRWLVNSPHKWPVTRKMFPFDDVIVPWQQPTTNRGLNKKIASINRHGEMHFFGRKMCVLI